MSGRRFRELLIRGASLLQQTDGETRDDYGDHTRAECFDFRQRHFGPQGMMIGGSWRGEKTEDAIRWWRTIWRLDESGSTRAGPELPELPRWRPRANRCWRCPGKSQNDMCWA